MIHSFRAAAVNHEPGARGCRVLGQRLLRRAQGDGVCGSPAAPTGARLVPWGCASPQPAPPPRPTCFSG